MTLTTRTSDSNGVVGRVVEGMADLSGTAKRAISDTAQKASGLAADLADEAVARSRRVAKAAVREAREHPATTLAMGAAVGALVAAIVMRMRQR